MAYWEFAAFMAWLAWAMAKCSFGNILMASNSVEKLRLRLEK